MQWNSKVTDFNLNGVSEANGDSGSGTNLQSLQSSQSVASAAAAMASMQPSMISMTSFHTQNSSKVQRPQKFACTYPNCDKTFSRRMNLKSHIQSSHEHKKPFQCSVCLKTFARHSDRRRHENNQHKTASGFVCGGLLKNGQRWGCGKVFKRKDGLIAHWRSQKARKKCLKNLPTDDASMLGLMQDSGKPLEFS
ncbi:hypothetical protein FOA43_003087 [Brettanomyces nanus]|uniref:C2H2-type domain-containing protein n=1 Tax=Eeniella nana TaxID=13502 RepID=A0A875RVQ3_EENNA|nr:uncharacterized protein FOA43_003087 [Brettanomyces nanus]QPG75727.1 hypothetical protein FOA43_003087 [Brettanomyces nanus]